MNGIASVAEIVSVEYHGLRQKAPALGRASHARRSLAELPTGGGK